MAKCLIKRRRGRRLLALALLGALAGGCAQAPMKPSEGHVRAQDTPAPAPGAIPAPVQISPVLPKPKATPKPETYSVVVNAVKVQELLFAVARDAKLNVDIHPGISGIVTLNAIDQTLPQLLSRIAKQVDMRWELDGPNLIVMPDSPYLRVYKIDYVNMDRRTTGSVGASAQVASGAAAGGGGGAAGGSNSSTVTVASSANNTFWATLERNIKDILRETDKVMPGSGAPAAPQAAPVRPPTPSAVPGAPGAAAPEAALAETSPNVTFREAASVIVNPESGVIIVRATSRQHEKIQEFVDQVMASAKRQVLIEATIVEVQLNNRYQQGIDWSILRGGSTGLSLTQVSSAAGLPSAPSVPNIFTIDVAARNFNNLSAVVRLLDSFGTVRVLSSPKLSVLNNQTALLRVVDNLIYFEVKATVATATNAPTTTSFDTTAKSVPVGFLMNVTPQISDNDTILLNVKPTVTRLLSFVADPNPQLGAIQNLVPQTRMREMESLIKVNSGQIAVLGGLIEDSVSDIDDTIPGIDQVPGLGSLFRSRNRTNVKTELVIFLSPVVVKDASIDGDFRSMRSMLPNENFMAVPNAGRTLPRPGAMRP
ncbi:MAG: pilus (MSHA type) biogenesis protein MshL [Betaproteobacteria bacterium]|nr:pilus (MSHA type) biogenesis protein MshL [Betaproteobacteria bacterium]